MTFHFANENVYCTLALPTFTVEQPSTIDRPPFLLVYTLSATVAEYSSVFMNTCREMAPSSSNCRQWAWLSTTKGGMQSH